MTTCDDLLHRYPNLRVMDVSHARQLGELFVQMSPDYFLSRFGSAYLARAFWARFTDVQECFGFVWVENGRVVGFAGGTVERTRFLRQVILATPFLFLRSAVVAAIRKPIVIKEGFELLRRLAAEDDRSGPGAELLILGVSPRFIRPVDGLDQGVSPSVVLLVAAASRMRQKTAESFRLYCTAGNRVACRFYRNLGFEELGRFRMFGKEKICYGRSTDFSSVSV